MAWVRIDDAIMRNPKIRAAGPAGFTLYVGSLCYSADRLTDGFIPERDVALIALEAQVPKKPTVKKLVDAGLWAEVDGGWMIPDFLQYNQPAEKVRAERAAAKERMRTIRAGGRTPPPGGQGSGEHTPERSGEQGANVRDVFGDPQPRPQPPDVVTSPSSSTLVGARAHETPGSVEEEGAELRQFLDAVYNVLIAAEVERKRTTRDPVRGPGYAIDRLGKLRARHDEEAARLADEHPGATPEQVARWLAGEKPPLRLVACPSCRGRRFVDIDDDGNGVPCPDCSAAVGGAR